MHRGSRRACAHSPGCVPPSPDARSVSWPALQDGDPSKPKVKVPEGYSFEIYNRDDIERIMVRRAVLL